MLAFATAVFFMIVTPGPGVLSLAGVGAAFGFKAGVRYLFGLFLGTNIVALGVITGLAAIVLAEPRIRTVLAIASVAYLLYLAARIAFAGSRIAFIEAKSAPGIRAALMLQAINPKAYVVNTTFFSAFPFAPDNLTYEITVKLIIANLIWLVLHFAWLWAGASLHRLNLSETTQRRINIGMALAMLAVVGLALYAGLTAAGS